MQGQSIQVPNTSVGLDIADQNLHLILRSNQGEQKGELWLGNLKAALNHQQLKQKQINTVLTVANNVQLSYLPEQGINHYLFKAPDDPNYKIQSIFMETNEIIEKALQNGSILVHCVAGISRSATLVIAYLMFSLKWGYEKAFYHVKRRRQINPNSGFRQQLISYSKYIQTQTKSDLNGSVSSLRLTPRSSKPLIKVEEEEKSNLNDFKPQALITDSSNLVQQNSIRRYASAKILPNQQQFQTYDQKIQAPCKSELVQNKSGSTNNTLHKKPPLQMSMVQKTAMLEEQPVKQHNYYSKQTQLNSILNGQNEYGIQPKLELKQIKAKIQDPLNLEAFQRAYSVFLTSPYTPRKLDQPNTESRGVQDSQVFQNILLEQQALQSKPDAQPIRVKNQEIKLKKNNAVLLYKINAKIQ